jgi:sterol desaturase/sphingolipid hydroxylase (fatty acid hydroxylase superfamily)
VVYDLTHYALHHVPLRGRTLRRLRAHHLRHHYGDHERGFGVTSGVWDWVFGTGFPEGAGGSVGQEGGR